MEFAISDEENLDNAESLAALSELNLYLDTPKAVLKVLKHFLRFAEITASVSLGGLDRCGACALLQIPAERCCSI